MNWPSCIVSPSPELEEKILATREQILSGKSAPARGTSKLLDSRSYTLIVGRPPATRDHTFGSRRREPAPVTGTKRAIVLLVDFPDAQATLPAAHYEDMLFSTGTYATGSMRDFFHEASYGNLDVIGSVHGWFRAPQPKSYYTNGDYGFGAYPQNAQKLAEDAIDLANPTVNFAPFDNDGDGEVEALVIICAGTGGEVTGNTGDIWSHKWGINPKTVDSVQVNRYFMAPEDGRVGVMAHELGHLLMAWPDLYDTDYSSAGTGRWDLMAGGSWNDGGNTPAHPTAWCKARAGWVSPTTLFNSQVDVVIPPYATAGRVYKLPIGSAASDEYFLVSNRNQTGFDTHLPGSGLIIEHCDDAQGNNTDENHYLVDIEQADGQRDLNLNVNRGDAADPFPSGGNTKFTATSTPNSNAYDGSDSQVSVTNIATSGANISATLNVGGSSALHWENNASVVRTYATVHAKNAWVFLGGIGWRKVHPDAPDGVTNTFMTACDALANARHVDVNIDGVALYQIVGH